DPPMVVWLNNNEAGEIGLKHLDRSIRFQREYGDRELDKEEKKRILHEAYDQKYQVLFDTARDTMTEQAWKNNSLFVAYNAWPRSVKGRTWERNHTSEWKRYDGAMPEFYLNDWQIYRGKTDYNYWSPQTEGLRIESSQDVIFDLDPDYYFASIAWDGGQPAVRRSAINCLATGMYGSGAVQRWDFDRYEGMVQFGLWAMRPRVMREFRYPVSSHDIYDKEAFMAVVRSVDRVWENETLAEFWRFGKLVKSEEFRPANKRVANELRFYSRVDALLPVDVNPPRDDWPRIWHFKAGKRPPVKLRVLALALELGEKPNRRWLIYAHAPLGAVDRPSVEISELGKVQLPFVARSGSFFTVEEGGDEAIRFADTLLRGSPAELALHADRQFLSAGESVTVDPLLTLPPSVEFASFQWTVGQNQPETAEALQARTFKLSSPGLHMIRVIGTTVGGENVVAETPVFVGKKPANSVVYDVALSDATAWQGPWKGIGKDKRELLTYRLVPNPGAAANMVLHGGRFVEDEDLDRPVLELRRSQEGLWGERSTLTCNKGYPNLTISLKFKAETLDGTQVLYAQGGTGKGYNIYVHEGKLYAGIVSFGGHWLSTDKIEPGQWHELTLALVDATDQMQDGRLTLYLDGEKVGTGPGRMVPNHNAAPRVGLCLNTTLHTGDNVSGAGFRGRIANFKQINAAPENPETEDDNEQP
ncbi:MAG: LamG-like jellyroll fold domain-containing protein, partial [Verrucomicrobiota bacterium]